MNRDPKNINEDIVKVGWGGLPRSHRPEGVGFAALGAAGRARLHTQPASLKPDLVPLSPVPPRKPSLYTRPKEPLHKQQRRASDTRVTQAWTGRGSTSSPDYSEAPPISSWPLSQDEDKVATWALLHARGHFCGLHSGHGVSPWRAVSGRAGGPPRGTHHPQLPVALKAHAPGVGAMPSTHASFLPDPWSSGQARAEASQRPPTPLTANAQTRVGGQPSGSHPTHSHCLSQAPLLAWLPPGPHPHSNLHSAPTGTFLSRTAGSREPSHQHQSLEGRGQVPTERIRLQTSTFP